MTCSAPIGTLGGAITPDVGDLNRSALSPSCVLKIIRAQSKRSRCAKQPQSLAQTVYFRTFYSVRLLISVGLLFVFVFFAFHIDGS